MCVERWFQCTFEPPLSLQLTDLEEGQEFQKGKLSRQAGKNVFGEDDFGHQLVPGARYDVVKYIQADRPMRLVRIPCLCVCWVSKSPDEHGLIP